jgi:hypothetical protein
MMPDMQLDDEHIGDFKIAQEPIDPPAVEEIERRQIIEFHGARLNWRLQRTFEERSPGRAFQRPRPGRPRSAAAKPKGFG